MALDYRTGFSIPTRTFSSSNGAQPNLPPFPTLDEQAPYAAYMFGNKYGLLCPDPVGQALGFRYDWSGNGRHIMMSGSKAFDDYSITGIAGTGMPTTPFTVDEIVDGDPASGFTIIAFVLSAVDAKDLNIARTADSDPLLQFSLLLPSPGAVRATFDDTGAEIATVTGLTTQLLKYSVYAASFNSSELAVHVKEPGGSLQSDTSPMTQTLASDQRMIMMWEVGLGDGANLMFGIAYYQLTLLGENVELAQDYFANWQSAIGNPADF